MFKKPKRNFRRRQNDSDEEIENGNGVDENSPTINNAVTDQSACEPINSVKKIKSKKSGKKEKIERSSSTLSFQDDEGDAGEEFQIRKSSHSRRVAKQLKRASLKEKEEREREDRERQERAKEPKEDLYSAANLEKMKLAQNKENVLTEEVMELGSDQDLMSSDEASDDDDDKSRSAPSLKDIFESGQIPDANMIHLARKRRQMAREKGDEFIPLDDTEKYQKDKSRLVREDDNDVSDEDEPINFTVNTNKDYERRHIQTTILAAAEESHSEGSDHDESWVEQQIRKGVQAGAATTASEGWTNATEYQQQSLTQRTGFTSTGQAGMGYTTAAMAPVSQNLNEVTVGSVKRRLQLKLEELRSVHRAHTNELSDVEARLASCQISEDTRQTSVRTLEEQYSFFQNMRGYVRDLVECLNEKMTAIVYLERCIHQLLKQRAEKLVKRRQDDIKDESLLFSKAKAGVVGGEGVDMSDGLAQRRAAERDGRRSRRRRAREARAVTDHYEGLSSDDEEIKSESTKFTLEREQAAKNAATLFEDVVEDFHELPMIKCRFESWKEKQSDTYEEAYIGLCLPKLFCPLVRLQLANWNPLEKGCPDLETMSWFETLLFYGSNKASLQETDVDLKLLSSLVEKAVIPKLTVLVETVYDPLSRRQTTSLVQTINKLVEQYPAVSPDSKNSQVLLKAVLDRLKRSLDDDVYVPLFPKEVTSAKNSPQSAFFHRQCWAAIKLFCNILQWHKVIGPVCLQELAFDGLLNRYLVLGLFNSPANRDTVAKVQAITEAIPDEWFSHLDGASSLPKLNNLIRIMVTLATTIDSASSMSEKKYSREMVKFITRMLVNIHAMTQAASLTEQFGLKV